NNNNDDVANKFLHSWKKRYFVLFEHKILNYYTTHENMTDSGLLGTLDLRRALWLQKRTQINNSDTSNVSQSDLEASSENEELEHATNDRSNNNNNNNNNNNGSDDSETKEEQKYNAKEKQRYTKMEIVQPIKRVQVQVQVQGKANTMSNMETQQREKAKEPMKSSGFLQRVSSMMKKSISFSTTGQVEHGRDNPLHATDITTTTSNSNSNSNPARYHSSTKEWLPAPYMLELATPGRTWL
ncbi:hypothetical protein RFI_03399, partial [Reticulomyxa filosa]